MNEFLSDNKYYLIQVDSKSGEGIEFLINLLTQISEGKPINQTSNSKDKKKTWIFNEIEEQKELSNQKEKSKANSPSKKLKSYPSKISEKKTPKKSKWKVALDPEE